MTRNRRALALLACLAFGGSVPLTAQRADTLFAAQASGDTAVDLDPIAIYSAGRFDSLPSGGEDPASEAFRSAAYSSGHRYWLYSGGERVGTVTTTGPGMVGCTGLPGIGLPRPTLLSRWRGLATADSTAALGGRRRAASAPELAALRGKARVLLVEAGAQAGVADTASPVEALVYEQPSKGFRWLIASFLVQTSTSSGESDLHAAFVLLEAEPAGARGALTWAHSGLEDDVQIRTLVDLFDFDRDGSPELITMTSYYESWDYQVWRRDAKGWLLWATTGGAGC